MSIPPPQRPCSSKLDAARQPSQALPGGHGHLYWWSLELGINQPVQCQRCKWFGVFLNLCVLLKASFIPSEPTSSHLHRTLLP